MTQLFRRVQPLVAKNALPVTGLKLGQQMQTAQVLIAKLVGMQV